MSDERSLSAVYIDTKYELRRLWKGEMDPLAREHLNHALAHLLAAASIASGASAKESALVVYQSAARRWEIDQRFHLDPVEPEVCDG